jgi:modification methylase ecoRI
LREDIEKELQYYETQFKDKIVLCNCDDYKESQFVKYFSDNFEKLQLKKLFATGFSLTGEKAQVFSKTKD